MKVKSQNKIEVEIKEEVEIDEVLKPGAKVKVPHPAKGKGMVTGKIVRYDKGGPHSPFYVVDIGEPRSEKIPAHKIKEEVEKENKLIGQEEESEPSSERFATGFSENCYRNRSGLGNTWDSKMKFVSLTSFYNRYH